MGCNLNVFDALVKMTEKKWVKTVVFVVALVICTLTSNLVLFFIQSSKYNMYLDYLMFDKEWIFFLLSVYLVCLVVPFIFLRYFFRGVQLPENIVLLLNMKLISVFVLLLGSLLRIDFLILMRLNSYFQI
jgi:hypothetical protein